MSRTIREPKPVIIFAKPNSSGHSDSLSCAHIELARLEPSPGPGMGRSSGCFTGKPVIRLCLGALRNDQSVIAVLPAIEHVHQLSRGVVKNQKVLLG